MRRNRLNAIAAVGALWAASLIGGPMAGTAHAQEPSSASPSATQDLDELINEPAPGGLWYGFAVGWAWSRVGCEVCRGNLVGGPSGMVQAGITQSRNLDLGLEVNGWYKSQEGVQRWQGVFNVMANWYPGPVRRLMLKAGFGMTLYRASDDEDAFTSTAFGPQFGIGYSIPVRSGLTFTPQLDVAAAGIGGDLQFNGESLGSGNYQLVRLAVGLTWH